MIATVTPNPAVDLTWHVERVVAGGTHRTAAGTARAGGKGINAARVLHATGHCVHALTTAGGATGDDFRRDLQASGIPHDLIVTAAATRRSAAVVDSTTGETLIVNEDGPALTVGEAEALSAAVEHLARRSGAVAISGSLRPGWGPEHLATVVRRLVEHVPVVVDTSGPGMLTAARAGAHVLKPNRQELAAATGCSDPVHGARALTAMGARLVVVSLGEEGLMIVPWDSPIVRGHLPHPLHGNATGAGDAVVAAICAAVAAGDDLWSQGADADAARMHLAVRATAWSAAAVLMPLAGEISPRHRALARDVRIMIDEDSR